MDLNVQLAYGYYMLLTLNLFYSNITLYLLLMITDLKATIRAESTLKCELHDDKGVIC
jgi:hypothetical protein